MSIYASYRVFARWGSRPEVPAELAQRFLETVDALHPLHPLFGRWTWSDRQELFEDEDENEGQPEQGRYELTQVREHLAHAMWRNMNVTEEGQPDPDDGYGFVAIAGDAAQPRCAVGLNGSVGKSPDKGGSTIFPWMNDVKFDLGPDPDPALTTYAFWRQALLIVAETWEASWAEAAPDDMCYHWSNRTFHAAWMCCLSPRLAREVVPPAGVIVEHRPNGGLFMAATDGTFRLDDPAHMARARIIEAALRPLDQRPFPIDDPYR